MGDLITLLKDYDLATILIVAILLIGGTTGIVLLVQRVKHLFDEYHKIRSEKEHNDAVIDERFKALEKDEVEDKAKLKEIGETIEEIKESINTLTYKQNRSNIATTRSSMYRLANELIDKKYMTQIEYETLTDLWEVYKMSSKENTHKPALVERALDLPVLTEEEIEKKIRQDLANKNDDGPRAK